MLFKKLINWYLNTCNKWNYQITKASEIVDLKGFFYSKSGRPGPVLIDITKDAQFEMVDANIKM